MPSSDFDHNYYTLQHPRRPSQESNHDQFPSVLDNADRKLCNPTPPSPDDQVSVIPTYSYSHPLQTPPKRPSISTDFDSYASEARLNGFTSDPPTDDNSPDPHDFYKPFRDPFTEALPGQRDIVVLGKEEGMTTSSYQRKPNPVPGRINGSSSKHAPIHPRISTRPSQYSASPTSGNSSPLNAAKSSPNLSGTARNRQTSLKDLVDKFNQTPNEKPLLPAKPGARSAASLLKPVSRPQALGRTRTPSQPALSGAGDSTNNSKSIREKPKNPSRSAQRRNYSNDGIRSPTNLTALSHTTQPNRSTIASNVGTSQFQREVSGLSPSREPFKPRLFGEILSVNTDSPDLGYGISAPRRRRGSEGSMHSPNPMFPHSRVEGDPGLSPSSPTAWYLGYTPSLDGVRTDRPGMHRRARSDFNGNTSKPVMASALGMHVATASPLPQPRGAKKSSSGSQRNSQSRIPVSTRRMSGTSDSGNSMPSSRADSALGRMSGNKSIPTGTSGLPRLRKKSISPIRTSRESTIRSSPRRQNHSPPPHHLRTSPLLKAYISAPLPKKSPPLRSSRPRQPVSSASTSASRAKAVDRPGLAKDAPSRDWKEPKHRKLPELGGVDFAARRQKIQQAIAKTVQEGEKKDQMRAEQRRITRRKADEERQAREEDQASEARKPYEKAHSEEAAVKESFEPDVEKAIGQDRTEPSDGAITLNDRHLTLDTTNLSRSFSHIDLAKANSSDNADSPTLGIPGSFSGLHPTVDRSHTPGSDRAPSSAMTAGTADTEDTVIDNEPQIDSTELDPRHRTILSQVMRMRASSPASPSRSVADDSVSDKDDRESIQIMLRATPVVDGPANSDEDEPQEEKIRDVFSNEGPCDRWSMDSWTSSVLDRQSQEIVRDAPNQLIDEPTPLQPEASAHSSFSTTAGSETPQHWSPAELSTPRTARKTLDSEAYSTINRILEHYHDPSLVSPQMMQDFQQQLLIQSPELARQGGWDPKRVTQLYLQELARGRLTSGSAVPGPLNIGLRRPFQPPLAPSHARTDIGKTEYEGSEVCGQDAEHGQEHTECADSSNRASLDVEPAELNPQRASLNHPDDWAHTSPSILDWIHPQARDSPVDERRESDYRPAPPPKERRSSPPRVDLSETIRTYQDESLLRREPLQTQPLLVDGGPRLPEIFGPGELGLAIRIDSPRDSSSPVLAPIPPLPDYSPPLPPIVPPIGEVLAASGASIQSPPSPSTYSKHNLSFQTISSENIAPKSSTRSSGASSQQHDLPTSSVQTSNSSSRSQERCELGPRSPSPESANKTPVTPEQKRLFKRWNVVKEIVDSEYSYRTDMLILDDIYRATAAPSGGLSAEDIRLLFGNLDQIMALSTELLDALKQAATSIYVIPKSSRWRAKRGSSSTSNTGNTDDQASMSGGDSLDDEKDRMTFIGEVFAHYMEDIEKVYAEYLRNHDAANKKLLSLQGTLLPDAWLKSCKEWSRDLTAAWDLDSLIVKPVQRVLKYPLLLTQLLEVTPENHPDYTALDIAVREIMGASHRINEMKKRADLVEQVVSSRKRKESDVRTGLSKAFGRRTEKLRQQVGLSELYEDKEYNILCEKLNYNFLRLQLVMRDFDSYTSDVQLFMDKFNEFVGAIEGFIDVGPTTHPELESKWRKFRMSMREVSATALTDHVSRPPPQVLALTNVLDDCYTEERHRTDDLVDQVTRRTAEGNSKAQQAASGLCQVQGCQESWGETGQEDPRAGRAVCST